MGVRATWVFACLVLVPVPSAGASLAITGFAMDLPDHADAIEITNRGPDPVALSDLNIADGNGALGFPDGPTLAPGRAIVVTTEDEAYLEASGGRADFALDAPEPERKAFSANPGFALANAGDEISLSINGTVVDAVRFGDEGPVDGWDGDAVPLRGGVFLRWFARTSADDSDSALDWTPLRRSYVGERLYGPFTSANVSAIVPYTAPEQSRTVVRDTLLAAKHSMRLNVYQFRDLVLADELAAHLRATPRLRMDVILDEAPVGESKDELSERGHVIDALAEAGAVIHMFEHDRYPYDHAKYAIVDDRVLLVQTENLVRSGIPLDAFSGNRGWGVVVEDAALAGRAATIFDGDFELRSYASRPAGEREEPSFPRPVLATAMSSPAERPVARTGPSAATLLATPFPTSGRDDPILELIRGAKVSLDVLELDFAPRWKDATGVYVDHPYLDALVDAARRGVAVRILLDRSFLDDSAGGDNQDLVAAVEARGMGLPIHARLAAADRVVHAKGMIVDGERVLVGSMNWNSNSLSQNREVGLVVDNADVAAFFTASFSEDWAAVEPRGGLAAPGVGIIITAIGLGVVVQGRRR